MPNGEAISGVLLLNGDVYREDDHAYFLGTVEGYR